MSSIRLRAAIAGAGVFAVLGIAACGGAYSGGSATSASVPPNSSGRASGTASPNSSAAGIPQNNGGDHDADNNGGPSDGDGSI